MVRLLGEAGHDRLAVSVDARSAALASLPGSIETLKTRGVACRVLFLEATSPVLLRRFSETRRRHPLAGAKLTLAEAIEGERALLADLSELGDRIDTSNLQPKALRNWIKDQLGVGAGTLVLTFQSFAFRDGIPLDADWVVDARMLPNPHYVAELRPLTGLDAPVIEYLDAQEAVQRFLEDLRAFLGRWLPEVAQDNRSYLTVAVGCTGGRHRSVYLTERLAASFRAGWRVLVRHRGLANTGAGADGD